MFDYKPTHVLIEQTKTKPNETLNLNLKKEVLTLFFDTPLKLEEGERLPRVTNLEVCNSVVDRTEQFHKFSASIPSFPVDPQTVAKKEKSFRH